MVNQSSAFGKLREFAKDRRAESKGQKMIVGLFLFGLLVYLVYGYVYPWWNTTVTPALGFLGTWATAGATIILFMLVGYGLVRYNKGKVPGAP